MKVSLQDNSDNHNNNFALRIQQLRLNNGWNKTDTAKQIGLTAGAYSNYEYGNRTPNDEIIRQIANVFNVDTIYLKTGISIDDSYLIYQKMIKDITKLHLLIEAFQNNNDINYDTKELLDSITTRLYSLQHLTVKSGEINYEFQQKAIKRMDKK